MTGPVTSTAQAVAALDQARDAIAATRAYLAATVPVGPAVTVSATAAGDGKIRVDWTTPHGDVTGWTVARDGTDSGGTGPWSTDLAAAARSYTMSSLVGGKVYTFTVTGHATAGPYVGSASTAATPAGPLPTPTGGDGPAGTAAARYGWGVPHPLSDEFDYTGPPDPAKWGVYNGPGNGGNGRRVAGQNTVGGGYLRQHGLPNGDTGGIASKRGQRYGRWEVCARVLALGASGNPYHPVLITWPDSDAWPSGGEYDFLEVNVGDGQAAAFLHHPTSSGVVQDHYTSAALDLTAWHNYGFDWAPSGLTGYIDGNPWFHDTAASVQAPGPMHLTIQLDCFFPQTGMREAALDVAWARIYAAAG